MTDRVLAKFGAVDWCVACQEDQAVAVRAYEADAEARNAATIANGRAKLRDFLQQMRAHGNPGTTEFYRYPSRRRSTPFASGWIVGMTEGGAIAVLPDEAFVSVEGDAPKGGRYGSPRSGSEFESSPTFWSGVARRCDLIISTEQ